VPGAATTRSRAKVKQDPIPPAEEPAGEPAPLAELEQVEDPNDPDPEHHRHAEVDGSRVVRDEPLLSGLKKAGTDERVPMRGTRVLTLEDGRRAYSCTECDFLGTQTREETDGDQVVQVISLRGEVRAHRIQRHGSKAGGRRRGGGAQDEELPLDAVDAAGLAYPRESVRSMTLDEILELAEAADQWGRMFGALTGDRDAWKERALKAESRIRQFERALEKIGFTLKLEPDDAKDGE
jgi:hypothetical protein